MSHTNSFAAFPFSITDQFCHLIVLTNSPFTIFPSYRSMPKLSQQTHAQLLSTIQLPELKPPTQPSRSIKQTEIDRLQKSRTRPSTAKLFGVRKTDTSNRDRYSYRTGWIGLEDCSYTLCHFYRSVVNCLDKRRGPHSSFFFRWSWYPTVTNRKISCLWTTVIIFFVCFVRISIFWFICFYALFTALRGIIFSFSRSLMILFWSFSGSFSYAQFLSRVQLRRCCT